jgi:hypothetical protein
MTLEQPTAFPPKSLKESIDSLQTQRGCADSMRYRRKKTAAVSVRLPCQLPVNVGALKRQSFIGSALASKRRAGARCSDARSMKP